MISKCREELLKISEKYSGSGIADIIGDYLCGIEKLKSPFGSTSKTLKDFLDDLCSHLYGCADDLYSVDPVECETFGCAIIEINKIRNNL